MKTTTHMELEKFVISDLIVCGHEAIIPHLKLEINKIAVNLHDNGITIDDFLEEDSCLYDYTVDAMDYLYDLVELIYKLKGETK